MKCLFIDLASKNAVLACVDSSVQALETSSERLSEDMVIPLFDRVLKEAKWQPSDITHIACVIGPGGFTGLRTGVTFANTLADQLNIPSVGIHLCDLYRARTDNSAVYWMHSTKKDQLFVCGGQWKEPTLIELNSIPCGDWMGELIEEHKKASGAEQISLKKLEDVLPELVSSLDYSTEILHPWYGRGW